MVHNIVSSHTLPFRHQVMKKTGKHIQGAGMGSLLLNKGGAGGASSYIDMDDYISTTGRNPFKSTQGQGLNKLASKISKLEINPPSAIKRKNITM
jgi:hypothetical protein